MQAMFSNCGKFDQPLINWDVSNVTSMENMFYQCGKFNQDITTWDTNNVTNYKDMFKDATLMKSNQGASDTPDSSYFNQ